MLAVALNFAGSRIGQIVIAFAVAWFWSAGRTESHWRAVVAAEKAAAEAAYNAEVARQERAAREIATAATARAAEDAEIERGLRKQIESFGSQEASLEQYAAPLSPVIHKPAIFCSVDRDFIDGVRRLDAAARKAKPSRPAR